MWNHTFCILFISMAHSQQKHKEEPWGIVLVPLCFQSCECRRNNEENVGQPCAPLKLIYELLKINNDHKKGRCVFFQAVEAATFVTFMFPCAAVCSDRCSAESGHKQGCKISDVCLFQRVKSETIVTCYMLSFLFCFFDIHLADNPEKLNRWAYEQTCHIPQKLPSWFSFGPADLNG